MKYREFYNSPIINNLVTEYESIVEKGSMKYYEESDFLQLVDYYEQETMRTRAIEVLDQAISCHPYSVSLFIKKAKLLMDEHQQINAIQILDQAALLSPDDINLDLLKVKAIALLGNTQEALSLVASLKEVGDSEILSNIYVVESIIYEQLEWHDEMFYALKNALELKADNEDALERIWLCVELSKKYKESIELHLRVVDNDPYSKMAWYNLGHAYAYLGQYAEAAEAYEYAYLIDDQFEFAYRDCAEVLFMLQYYDQALHCYEEILEQFEPDADLYMRIGQCYFHLNSIKKARHYLTHSILLDPLNDEVLYHIGISFSKEGEWRNAISFYEKAIEIEDRREEYWSALGEAHCQLKEWIVAEECFQEATEIAPEQSKYWFQYAQFLIQQGKENEAFLLLEEAQDYSVGAELIYCQAACSFATNQNTQGLNLLQIALEEEIEQYQIIFDLMPHLLQDEKVKALIAYYLEA